MTVTTDIDVAILLAPFILTVVGAYYLYISMKKKRVFMDTPTSKIHSAAQGYVQLEGTGHIYDDIELRGPHTNAPCLWYDYLVERREGSGKDAKWVTEEHITSTELFMLQDKTGWCVINPVKADVIESHKVVNYQNANRSEASWYNRYYRVTEKTILPKVSMTVIGEYQTIRRIDTMGGSEALLGDLVKTWKADYDALLAKYDTDGDGQIDADEWERVLADARQEVQRERADAQAEEGVNTMAYPYKHRKPYVISTKTEEELIRRYNLHQGLSILALLIAVGMFIHTSPIERIQILFNLGASEPTQTTSVRYTAQPAADEPAQAIKQLPKKRGPNIPPEYRDMFN